MTGLTERDLLADEKPETDPARDQLGYSAFARHLASAILRMTPEQGLVIAVYGPWGSGKTTLVNFVRHYLSKAPASEQPAVIEFNPWWFSGTEDLTRRFFDQLLEELGQHPFLSKELREAVAQLGNLASKLPVMPVKIAGEAAKLVRPKLGDIVKIKARIAELLTDQSQKLLIVLDDVDRLTPEEVRELLRLVKSVGDFPNVVYLLSFDRDVVKTALSAAQIASGDAYLEKIVQVPFELPLPDKADLQRLLFLQLQSLLNDLPQAEFDRDRWNSIYLQGIDPLIQTPRHIARLMNTLRVTYPPVKREVSAVDFLGIEALRVFAPEAYDVVRRNRELFAGQEQTHAFGMSRADMKRFHDGWLERVLPEHVEPVKRLVSQLFPKVAYAWGGSGHAGDWESRWRKELRVCSPDIFAVYFRLAVPQTGVSALELRALLDFAHDAGAFGNALQAAAREVQASGVSRARAILERLPDHAGDIPLAFIPNVLRGLYDNADLLLPAEDEPQDWLGFSNDILISRLTFRLLDRYSETERFRLLGELVDAADGLGLLVYELALLGQEQGRYGSSGGLPPDQWTITQEHLASLEERALRRIRRVARQEPSWLLGRRKLAALLHRWLEWGRANEVRRWAGRVSKDDQALLRILEEFLMVGSTGGRAIYSLPAKSLEDFLDTAEVARRVRAFGSEAPVTKWQRIAVEEFLRSYEGRTSDSA